MFALGWTGPMSFIKIFTGAATPVARSVWVSIWTPPRACAYTAFAFTAAGLPPYPTYLFLFLYPGRWRFLLSFFSKRTDHGLSGSMEGGGCPGMWAGGAGELRRLRRLLVVLGCYLGEPETRLWNTPSRCVIQLKLFEHRLRSPHKVFNVGM